MQKWDLGFQEISPILHLEVVQKVQFACTKT